MTITYGNTKDLGGAVKIMSYGPAGVGKTKLCGTAPSPLVISTENGLLSLKKEGLPYMTVETLLDFQQAYTIVTTSDSMKGFDTICIDSASDIAESILISSKKTSAHGQAAYGDMADGVIGELRKWRALPDKHVYITCKEMIIGTQRTTGMPGKVLPNYMPYWGDELFAVKVIPDEQDPRRRWLQTQPDLEHYAKDRSGTLEYYEPADLTYIFNKIMRGG